MIKSLLLVLFGLAFHFSYAQCKITIAGTPCLETDLQFSCNSSTGTSHYWKFNSDDSFNLNCDPIYGFSTPGNKRITLRVKDAQGNTCLDTTYITIRSLKAHMSLSQSRPICETIIDAFDSSYILQPLDSEQDSIVTWTYQWFDNTEKLVSLYNATDAKNFKAVLKHNGNHPFNLKTVSKYGCESSESMMIYVPGPIPYFDTFIPRQYCTNEKIGFNNMSQYNLIDSCIWVWTFGDPKNSFQYDSYTSKDTVWHQYDSIGTYHVRLYLVFITINSNGLRRNCTQVYPDTTGLKVDPIKLSIIDCANSSVHSPFLNSGVNVYPNPASQTIQIAGIETEIYMINSQGKVIHHFYNNTNQLIEIGHIPEGLYLLTDNNFRVLSKLIVKRE